MWDLLIIEWLLEEVKMDVNARRGKYGMTPLMAALLTKDQEIIKIVLSNGANIG
jgi:ankyrin repeat protein